MKLFRKKEIYRGDDRLYLVRYSLFQCKWFAVKVHHILLSDDDCHHNHPWNFLSLILWNGYIEHRKFKLPDGVVVATNVPEISFNNGWMEWARRYGMGKVIYRKATDIHKLEIDKPAWTLVITFRKQREWGFFTPRGWVQWFKYRSTGSKCE